MIELTTEYTEGPKARSVPGAYRNGRAWVLDEPTPRAAVVALKLFPGIEHEYPELLELRDALLKDVRPVDHATPYGKDIGAPRLRAIMAERGWSLNESKAEVIDAAPDYQSKDLGYAADILRRDGGFYLGWDRGLGKTLGTIALMDELDTAVNIIAVPNSGKEATWASELAWAAPWLETVILPNDKAKRERTLERVKGLVQDGTPFALVVHYEALAIIAGVTWELPKSEADLRPDWPRKLSTYERGRLPVTREDGYDGPLQEHKTMYKRKMGDGWAKLLRRAGKDDVLVAMDEGHRIKNPTALQNRAARKIPARYRLCLSGSVVENDWEEPFGPAQFLYPKRYRSKWRNWNDRFLDFVENGYGKTCVGVLEGQEDTLRQELGVWMILRHKQPKAQATTLYVDLSVSQRAAYEELQEKCLAELADGTRVKADVGIAMLTKLRQLASGLDLVSHELRDSSKLDSTEAVIQRWLPRGDDFVVFVWYKSTAYALQRRLDEAGIDNFVITGDVPQGQRAEWIADFQRGEGRVMIGTIATMGESINLQRANHVIRVDRSFNPALNLQAVDRVDRQGQQRDVYLTDIVAKDTVDDLVVMPNLANKEALRATILGGTA